MLDIIHNRPYRMGLIIETGEGNGTQTTHPFSRRRDAHTMGFIADDVMIECITRPLSEVRTIYRNKIISR